jgi:hypothetical protein
MQFSEIDTSSVRCSDFPQVKSAIGGGCEEENGYRFIFKEVR